MFLNGTHEDLDVDGDDHPSVIQQICRARIPYPNLKIPKHSLEAEIAERLEATPFKKSQDLLSRGLSSLDKILGSHDDPSLADGEKTLEFDGIAED